MRSSRASGVQTEMKLLNTILILASPFYFMRTFGEFSNRSSWLLGRRHWPVESHLNSRRYHFVLITPTCPPVVCTDSEKRLRPDWYNLTLSVVGVVGDGDIWIMD